MLKRTSPIVASYVRKFGHPAPETLSNLSHGIPWTLHPEGTSDETDISGYHKLLIEVLQWTCIRYF